MNSLSFLNLLRWEFILQIRNGFYFVTAFSTIVIAIALNEIPIPYRYMFFPTLIFMNLMINNFIFIIAMVLFEKNERVFDSLTVSPFRCEYYLISKAVTLLFLSVVETLVLALITFGTDFNIFPLMMGVILVSFFFVFIGFITVAKYENFNDVIFLITPVFLISGLGLLAIANITDFFLLYAIPTTAGLYILNATYFPLENWELLYGYIYGTIAVIGSFLLARRSYIVNIIEKKRRFL